MTEEGEAEPVSKERPRLKEIDHEAPDDTSASGVFDRGTAERVAREQGDERQSERADDRHDAAGAEGDE